MTATRLVQLATGFHLVAVDDAIYIFPPHEEVFAAVVSASCSALPSLLGLFCLSIVIPGIRGHWQAVALVVACAVITCGNVLRIAGSVAYGELVGRSSLVLFHDWVGSIFAVLYTLAGYILMLMLLAPAMRTHVELDTR